MKKGDIVVLKSSERLLAHSAFNRGSDSRLIYQLSKRTDVPKELTVSGTGTLSACCVVFPTVSFDETGDLAFDPRNFDVVLVAGEPDVIKLMEEAKYLELASIGF